MILIKLFIISLMIALQGCTTYAGLAVHSSKDSPEYDGANPLFVIRSQSEDERFFYFCEHVSSVPDTEKGYGLNMCGAGVKF